MSTWNIAQTEYPAVRRVMGPDRRTLDDRQLERLLGELFPGAEPDDVENFMRTVQRFGKQVAPIAQRALPGVVQGAATGAAVGGPWGALIGAVGGGVSGALTQPGPATRPTPGAPAPGTAPLPPRAAPAPTAVPVMALPQPVSPMAPASPGAPAQLLALLSRPETLQALLALLMRNAGGAVNVAGNAVPAGAFANAVAEIAGEAASCAPAYAGDGVAEFLLDEHGHPRIDIANPAERAQLLLADLFGAAEEEELDDAGSSMWEAEEAELIDALDGYYSETGVRHV